MAYTTQSHTTLRINAFFSDFVSDLSNKFAARRAYNRTVRELSALDRSQLADLGLHTGMIHSVARDVTYGPQR